MRDLTDLRATLRALYQREPAEVIGQLKGVPGTSRACEFLRLSDRAVQAYPNAKFRDGAQALDTALAQLYALDQETLRKHSERASLELTGSHAQIESLERGAVVRAALGAATRPQRLVVTPEMAQAIPKKRLNSLSEITDAAAEVVRTGGLAPREGTPGRAPVRPDDLKAQSAEVAAFKARVQEGLDGASNNPRFDFAELLCPEVDMRHEASTLSGVRMWLYRVRATLQASFTGIRSDETNTLQARLLGNGMHDERVRELLAQDPDKLTLARCSNLSLCASSLQPVLDAANGAAANRYAELTRTGDPVPLADVANFARVRLGLGLKAEGRVEPDTSAAVTLRKRAALALHRHLEKLKSDAEGGIAQSAIDECVVSSLSEVLGNPDRSAEGHAGAAHASAGEGGPASGNHDAASDERSAEPPPQASPQAASPNATPVVATKRVSRPPKDLGNHLDAASRLLSPLAAGFDVPSENIEPARGHLESAAALIDTSSQGAPWISGAKRRLDYLEKRIAAAGSPERGPSAQSRRLAVQQSPSFEGPPEAAPQPAQHSFSQATAARAASSAK
ncbi:hypothetical protein EZ242_07455 [Ramlibacter rhizophilus]|uniref:Uncharacterized protein n=1 Tax=Ramlibacter rhizophilus TaxID=1781167 RepID=A0A4Z0BR17_9BURK|nr:hypothetical protein EZ242_07455 [Ramlibacter rhizophilus]